MLVYVFEPFDPADLVHIVGEVAGAAFLGPQVYALCGARADLLVVSARWLGYPGWTLYRLKSPAPTIEANFCEACRAVIDTVSCVADMVNTDT